MAKHFFAGGNTADGFFSYFDNMLPIEEAKRIFVIKGGPGTGKSTLMKEIASDMEKACHTIELCHCSSDNNSLDGVLIKDISVLIVDGTAPHIVDLKVPGIVDEIVYLGDFWNEDELQKHKKEIMNCQNKTSSLYGNAYSYLAAAGELNKIIENINSKYFDDIHAKEIADRVLEAIEFNPKNKFGKKRKLFLNGITPDGIINYAENLSYMSDKTIVLATDVNINTGQILERIAKHFIENGIDIEAFYSPFAPASQIEHLYAEDLGLFITTKNRLLDFSLEDESITNINIDTDSIPEEDKNLLKFNFEMSEKLINKAVECIHEAREVHSEIEKYYIESMDFGKLNEVKESIINKIKSIS